jgi:hypothetical protein
MREGDRDKKIVDSGWGIKPDDQPANAAEADARAAKSYRYDPNEPDVVRKMLLAQRRGFNTANRVRVERGRTIIFDINGDGFVIEGLSFGDENLIAALQALGAGFNPAELRTLRADEPVAREYAMTRAWAWGAERSG